MQVGIIGVSDVLHLALTVGAWSLSLNPRNASPHPSAATPTAASSSPVSPTRRALRALGSRLWGKKEQPAQPVPATAVLSPYSVSKVLATSPSVPIPSLAADSPLDLLVGMFHKLPPRPSSRASQTVFVLQEAAPFHISSAVSSHDMCRCFHDNIALLGPLADEYLDASYEAPVDPDAALREPHPVVVMPRPAPAVGAPAGGSPRDARLASCDKRSLTIDTFCGTPTRELDSDG